MNDLLTRPTDLLELKAVLNSMRKESFAGPDGFISDVDKHCCGNEGNERDDRADGRASCTTEPAELYLNEIDEGYHEEAAAQHRSDSGGQDAGPEYGAVDACHPWPGRWADETDGLLETECNETREQERREGEDVERDEVLKDPRASSAVSNRNAAVARIVRIPGEAKEYGQSEKGVDIHDPIKSCDMDARSSLATPAGGGGTIAVDVSLVHCFGREEVGIDAAGGSECGRSGERRVDTSHLGKPRMLNHPKCKKPIDNGKLAIKKPVSSEEFK
ncbi:hypothetical protein HPP92_022094 [Vanilla planifolia]|uniref:Uncharacterized protein n=1 Tax=Vanilla planifolia TaxID=51239 RepID=A0A835UCW1_VANPL|nr:hypothetical protein HPP92_022094 [Vanilla planifolia]